MTTKKILVLQRVLPKYRLGVFKRLSNNTQYNYKLIIGSNVVDGKAFNSNKIEDIDYIKLQGVSFNILGRRFYWQKRLLKTLVAEKPSLIICEAESHFLGYLVAILYKLFFNRKAKLVLWCYYALPGLSRSIFTPREIIKSFARMFFEGFISYHSFGKNYLIRKGYQEEKIAVAYNVCNTDVHLRCAKKLAPLKHKLMNKYTISENLVVSFVGSLVTAKKPDIFLNIAKSCQNANVLFLVVGDGPELAKLEEQARRNSLDNVKFMGYLEDEVTEVISLSDVVVLPSRGGIIISEAMCYSTIPIVYQGDGIELDLIVDGETGFLTKSDKPKDFASKILMLNSNRELLSRMKKNTLKKINNNFDTVHMSKAISEFVNKILKGA